MTSEIGGDWGNEHDEGVKKEPPAQPLKKPSEVMTPRGIAAMQGLLQEANKTEVATQAAGVIQLETTAEQAPSLTPVEEE